MNPFKRFIGGLLGVGLAFLSQSVSAAGPGTVKFDQSSVSVLEEAGVALVVVERSQGEDGLITVAYSSADVTATAGSDYNAVAGTISWADGDGGNKTITVPTDQRCQPGGRRDPAADALQRHGWRDDRPHA